MPFSARKNPAPGSYPVHVGSDRIASMIRAYSFTRARGLILAGFFAAVVALGAITQASIASARVLPNSSNPKIALLDKKSPESFTVLAQKKRYQKRRRDNRYQNRRPTNRYQNRRPTNRYQNRRPKNRYQNSRPNNRYETRRRNDRYQNRRERNSRSLNNRQSNSAVSSGRAASLGSVARSVRRRVPGQLLDARLIKDRRGKLTYRLKILGRNGVMRNVTADAYSGAILGVR